jgi:hypothetical protein
VLLAAAYLSYLLREAQLHGSINLNPQHFLEAKTTTAARWSDHNDHVIWYGDLSFSNIVSFLKPHQALQHCRKLSIKRHYFYIPPLSKTTQ